MKKLFALALALLLLASPIWAAQDEGLDLVVLLDDSASMFGYFDQVKDFIVSFVIKDYLRPGDSFNLILFSDKARIEEAVSMTEDADLKALLGRIYMVLPLGTRSDIPSALEYTYEYASGLSEARHSKTIVIISDGIHNPPPGSPYAGKDEATLAADTQSIIGRMRGNGWKVRFIKIPFELPAALKDAGTKGTGPAASGTGPAAGTPTGSSAVSEATAPGATYLGEGIAGSVDGGAVEFSPGNPEGAIRASVGAPKAYFPGDLGDRGREFSFPLGIENTSTDSITLELVGVTLGSDDILAQKAFLTLAPGEKKEMGVSVVIPAAINEGRQSLEVTLAFANDVRVTPAAGNLAFNLAINPFADFLKRTGTVLLFIALFVVIAAAVLIVLFALRKSRRKAGRVAAETSARGAEAAGYFREREAVAPRPVAGHGPRVAVGSGEGDIERYAGLAVKDEGAEDKAALDSYAKDIAEGAAGRGYSVFDGFEPGKDEGKDLLDSFAGRVDEGRGDPLAGYKVQSEDEAATLAAFARKQKEVMDSFYKLPPARKKGDIAAAEGAEEAHYTVAVKKSGRLLVEFRVDEQNPRIGMRNVHFVSAGSSKTIGGGNSDFLVYFVNLPARIAEFQFDGEKLWIVPIKKEHFPGLTGPKQIELGEAVEAVSKKGYPFTIRVSEFIKPADRINNILRIVDLPGTQPESPHD